MLTLIYRCPVTSLNVQAWFADEVPTNEGELYESVTCLACTQTHLVNRTTGETLGYDDG